MKTTTVYIGVNIKTTDGFESIGRFYIGNDREFARTIFKKLKADDEVDETSVPGFPNYSRINIKIITQEMSNE